MVASPLTTAVRVRVGATHLLPGGVVGMSTRDRDGSGLQRISTTASIELVRSPQRLVANRISVLCT